MNILDISAKKRFNEWHTFRSSLSETDSDNHHLKSVAEYWGKCPIVQFYVDWDNPKTWETPWQLIHDGNLCPSGIAICMYHTLLNVKDDRWKDRIKLQLIKDKIQGCFLIVNVDGHVLLNYIVGKVFDGSLTDGHLYESYIFRDGKYIELK